MGLACTSPKKVGDWNEKEDTYVLRWALATAGIFLPSLSTGGYGACDTATIVPTKEFPKGVFQGRLN